MKRVEHMRVARLIGNEAHALLNYDQLPRNASVKRQLEALHADQRWQESHQTEVSSRIDVLMRDIEIGSNTQTKGAK